MLQLLDQETIVDEDGRYRFLSEEAFCDLTKSPDRCFVCLTAPSGETQEHVISNWIIRTCNLKNQTISLGNGNSVPYPRYKIPCCERCNQKLREEYEDDISRAVKSGMADVYELHKGDPTLILRWLNLIFFKTHYKDLFMRRNLDQRSTHEMIGDAYDWGIMQLPHSLFRSPFNDIRLESGNIGSLFVVRILNPTWADVWDYRDDFITGIVYLRIMDLVFIGVLNDGGLTSQAMRGRFDVEQGAYVAQTLEMLTDCQMFNYEIASKPDYIKCWDQEKDYTSIRVDLPGALDRKRHNAQRRHELFWSHLKQYKNLEMSGGMSLEGVKNEILQGKISMALKPAPASMRTSSELLEAVRSNPDSSTFYGL